ncbi:hypothetical protein [Caulobacter sp. S45]|uniref:hypothetical protein n=1 Tax=Caulobacter sp. S45 TaxID=1641861 RepID=UPI00131C04C0|nr:hypothetical protein [Caulobacter sp. S45]
MSRAARKRGKPSSPEEIRLAAARRRADERVAANDPSNWTIANDTLALPSGDGITTNKPNKRAIYAKRCDPFELLHRKGGLSEGQFQAANRLFKDWCDSMGIRTEDARPTLEIIDQAPRGPGDLVNARMLDAGARFEQVLSMIGRANAAVLRALVQPLVMCGSALIWRAEVQRITGEGDTHGQGTVVRQACENLRLAYSDIDQAARSHHALRKVPAAPDQA